MWRKYVYAGGTLFGAIWLVDQQWNVVGNSRFFMHERALLGEEREWLRRPVAPQTDSIDARVGEQFEELGSTSA